MVGLLALFGFAAPFGEYMLSKILLTDPTKFTLALGVYSGIFSKMTVDYAMFAAAAILSALPIVIIYMSLQKIIMEGLSGATK
jgi:arabinogalactan oligomer/maltooligosaccharide transport system permease protein